MYHIVQTRIIIFLSGLNLQVIFKSSDGSALAAKFHAKDAFSLLSSIPSLRKSLACSCWFNQKHVDSSSVSSLHHSFFEPIGHLPSSLSSSSSSFLSSLTFFLRAASSASSAASSAFYLSVIVRPARISLSCLILASIILTIFSAFLILSPTETSALSSWVKLSATVNFCNKSGS